VKVALPLVHVRILKLMERRSAVDRRSRLTLLHLSWCHSDFHFEILES
jgi:hypothetical protein